MTRVADTSHAAHAMLAKERATRETLVLDGLRRYRRAHDADPTAYELLRFLQVENPTLDLNAVRPRLTELEFDGRVAKGDKRRCLVTEKRVYTWAVASPSRAERSLTTPYADAVTASARSPIQTELFR
jgi:hypothetical protein